MKIRTIQDVNALKDAVDMCSRDVWLEDLSGRRYDLKNELEQYVAIGALLQDKDEQLELFASDRNDKMILVNFVRTLVA